MTWCIEHTTDDEQVGFCVYLRAESVEQAKKIQEELQTICGSRIERDDDFLYALVSDPEKADRELIKAGYETQEV